MGNFHESKLITYLKQIANYLHFDFYDSIFIRNTKRKNEKSSSEFSFHRELLPNCLEVCFLKKSNLSLLRGRDLPPVSSCRCHFSIKPLQFAKVTIW